MIRLAATLTRDELTAFLIEARAPLPPEDRLRRIHREINRFLPGRLRGIRNPYRSQPSPQDRLYEAHLELLPIIIDDDRRRGVAQDKRIAIYEDLLAEARRFYHKPRQKSARWQYWATDLADLYFREIDPEAGWTRYGPACKFVSFVVQRFLGHSVAGPGAVESGVLDNVRRGIRCLATSPAEPCLWVTLGRGDFDCPVHSPLLRRRRNRRVDPARGGDHQR